MQKPNYQKIIKAIGEDRVKIDEPMSKHTTFKIGGPADLFYVAKTENELLKSIRLCEKEDVPYFILGNGSNILVSDKGYRGLMINNQVIGIESVRNLIKPKVIAQTEKVPHVAADPKKYLKVEDLICPDEPFIKEVIVFSGTPIPRLIDWTYKNKMTGLQWFAGIPGTVGGAVVHNIHGYTKLFSNYINRIWVINNQGRICVHNKKEIGFGYDYSDFLIKRKVVILKVSLFLSSGDVNKAAAMSKEWKRRKQAVQPQSNCAGSIFKNIDKELAEKLGSPTPSVGWFIDIGCGLKGKKIGQAQISEKHANFIVNLGGAKAKDVVALIDLTKSEVKNKFSVELKEEIIRVGEF